MAQNEPDMILNFLNVSKSDTPELLLQAREDSKVIWGKVRTVEKMKNELNA